MLGPANEPRARGRALNPNHKLCQAEHGDPPTYVDRATGVTVYSVYRRDDRQLRRVIDECAADVILADLQDVGTRLYTFVWTLYALMRAAPSGFSFVVTDRPNPLGGAVVEGPLLNTSCCASRYGYAPIPHRHGMTVGELARYFGARLGARVDVWPMSGWRRAHSWADTRLPWIAPSPNLPTAASAVAYGATVFVEATTISEGRGTALPFELLGAPHINSSSLARELNGVETAARAARWRAAYFTPSWWKYNNSVCDGVQYVRPDRARLFADGVALLGALRAFGFEWDGS